VITESVTIKETEDKQKQNRDDDGKVFDIAHLDRYEDSCSKHDRRYGKAVGIRELRGIFESSNDNDCRYHNWIQTLGLVVRQEENAHESN
jgi:hypothetical protein